MCYGKQRNTNNNNIKGGRAPLAHYSKSLVKTLQAAYPGLELDASKFKKKTRKPHSPSQIHKYKFIIVATMHVYFSCMRKDCNSRSVQITASCLVINRLHSPCFGSI
jgi:hypothetical protein